MTRWPRGQRWTARVVLGFLGALPFIIAGFIRLKHHESMFPIPIQSHNLDVVALVGTVGVIGWGCVTVAAGYLCAVILVSLVWLFESAFSAEPKTWKHAWKKVFQ